MGEITRHTPPQTMTGDISGSEQAPISDSVLSEAITLAQHLRDIHNVLIELVGLRSIPVREYEKYLREFEGKAQELFAASPAIRSGRRMFLPLTEVDDQVNAGDGYCAVEHLFSGAEVAPSLPLAAHPETAAWYYLGGYMLYPEDETSPILVIMDLDNLTLLGFDVSSAKVGSNMAVFDAEGTYLP